MRVFNVQPAARPTPIDRNPVNRTQYHSAASVAPHGNTVRWTYTVPAGKKAVVQMQMGAIVRITAAAPVGQCVIEFDYTPNGGSQTALLRLYMNTNNVNDHNEVNVAGGGDMSAGDVFSAQDVDLSTGGTVTFDKAAKIFEYDA